MKTEGNNIAVDPVITFLHAAGEQAGWHSPPFKGRGRGGVRNFFRREEQTIRDSLRILETPPLPRLRPTVASLPNCSLLAIALKGGERLRVGDRRSGMWLPPETSRVNCYIIAKKNQWTLEFFSGGSRIPRVPLVASDGRASAPTCGCLPIVFPLLNPALTGRFCP